jgi:hypothetical protein
MNVHLGKSFKDRYKFNKNVQAPPSPNKKIQALASVPVK